MRAKAQQEGYAVPGANIQPGDIAVVAETAAMRLPIVAGTPAPLATQASVISYIAAELGEKLEPSSFAVHLDHHENWPTSK